MRRAHVTRALLNPPELVLILTLADALIRTSCRQDAVAFALHPPRWIRRSVVKQMRGGMQKVLPSTPLLRATTKHLVAVAKRFLTAESWSRKKVAHDAKQYLALQTKQHASDNELLAIMVFVEALGYMRKRHCPRLRQAVDLHGMRPKNDGVYMRHNTRN